MNPAEAWLREHGIEPIARRGPLAGSGVARDPTQALPTFPPALLSQHELSIGMPRSGYWLPDDATADLETAETVALPAIAGEPPPPFFWDAPAVVPPDREAPSPEDRHIAELSTERLPAIHPMLSANTPAPAAAIALDDAEVQTVPVAQPTADISYLPTRRLG